MSSDVMDKYANLDWEKMHWIAPSLGEKYERLMSYSVWTYDALLEARRFFFQFKIKPFVADNVANNWVDFGYEYEIQKWKGGPPLLSRTPEEINEILLDPEVTGDLKAKFSYAFHRKAETYLELIKAELDAYKKVDREPFEDFSDIFYTKWTTGGNCGFVVSTSGQNGSAKTGWLVLVAEMALRRTENMKMVTNIMVRPGTESARKRIQSFSTIGEWIRILLVNKIEGFRSHSPIDELTNSNIRRKATMHATTLSFDRMDKNTRKLDDDNDYAWHFRTEVPKEVESKSVFKVTKHGSTLVPQQRHMADIDFDYGHGWKRKYLNGIPQPTMPYVSEAWAFFVLDIDVDQIWLEFAKVQRAEDDEMEATHKRLEIVEAAIQENQESELEPDSFLPIKEAVERAGMSRDELLSSKYFIKSDRKAAGWFVKPIPGRDWDLNVIEEVKVETDGTEE